ncbi:MAG: hypothetical protein EHM72_17265, partial [Calditrichaeota bacterium]
MMRLCRFFSRIIVVIAGLGILPYRLFAADAKIDPGSTYQTIEGFGASIAWYDNWLPAHPYRGEIYDLIFNDLGLDILRLRNAYRYQSGNFCRDIQTIVQQAGKVMGHPPRILMSSWSPPADLKSNGKVEDGGTLAKKDGQYMYEEFADYWMDALAAYEALGIVPTYISIQNEPSFKADWESCVFKETETADYAGYDKALKAVYDKLQHLPSPPRILAPEVLGIGYSLFQTFSRKMNPDYFYGYAHHLYHGGDENNPDSFKGNMSAIAKEFDDKPIFQTEYDRGDWFNTAWIMHNSLVFEGVAGYLYWGLIWGGGGLVNLENPWNSGSWTTDHGYIISDAYWAFRQYAAFIDYGWKRIKTETDSPSLRISAYRAADGDSLTVVILNVAAAEAEINLSVADFETGSGRLVQTSAERKGEELGEFIPGNSLKLAGKSITTISLTGTMNTRVADESTTIPTSISIDQNYPNPFN